MNETILIIEDNVTMRENIRDILSLADYNTISAENGMIGLELAKKYLPDLILSDIMMPELDGYGVLRAIENMPALANIPVVFITAKSEISDFRKSMDLGADDYLIKPFSGDDILKVVAARIKKNKNMRVPYHNLEGMLFQRSKRKEFSDLNLFKDFQTVKKIKRKELIYREGDVPHFLYYVISGKVKSFKTNEFSRDYLTGIYNEGDFFGYLSIIENSNRIDSTMTMEDSEIACIPKEYFYQMLHSNNEIALKFIKYISDNLHETEDKLLKLAYDSARKRTSEALLFIYHKYQVGDKNNEAVPINREDISAIAGITAESVSRNLTSFREEGLIEINNNMVKILDLLKLENLKN
ncbi:MAG: response regulator [Bacteroidia bacterium]